ncbi:hypothetical protein SUGI_0129420 [Cryptomeria japonica]|nr:hypothetical protein SUGI_0129420 [Cryptomeria japonica]
MPRGTDKYCTGISLRRWPTTDSPQIRTVVEITGPNKLEIQSSEGTTCVYSFAVERKGLRGTDLEALFSCIFAVKRKGMKNYYDNGRYACP